MQQCGAHEAKLLFLPASPVAQLLAPSKCVRRQILSLHEPRQTSEGEKERTAGVVVCCGLDWTVRAMMQAGERDVAAHLEPSATHGGMNWA
jgi:hypothetical protein